MSYRTGRYPIGRVGDPFAGVMDPDRDPRFIATGRAALAAMTCGQIDLLTSTPLGCRTPGASLIVRHPGGVAGSITISDPRVVGATPLRPVARKRAPPEGCLPAAWRTVLSDRAMPYRTCRSSRTGRRGGQVGRIGRARCLWSEHPSGASRISPLGI